TSARVTSWIEPAWRWSIKPPARSCPASTSAAASTARWLRPRISAASDSGTARLSAKQTASSAGAMSSASKPADVSGTTARPKMSTTTESSIAANRDRPEGLPLLHRRLAQPEQFEEREKACNRLQSCPHRGEKLLELKNAGSEPGAQLFHLFHHREGRGSHRERLVARQPFQDPPEGSGEPLRGDPHPLDRDHVGRHDPEKAACALLCRTGEKSLRRRLV